MADEREPQSFTQRTINLGPGEEARITLPGEEIIFRGVAPARADVVPPSIGEPTPPELRKPIDDMYLEYWYQVINVSGSVDDRDAFLDAASDKIIHLSELLEERKLLTPSPEEPDVAGVIFEQRAKTMLWRLDSSLAEAHGRFLLQYLRERAGLS